MPSLLKKPNSNFRALYLAVTLPLCLSFFPSCSDSQKFLSNGSSSDNNKSDPRPTEESEGLPGYLTDPALISIRVEAKKGPLIGGKQDIVITGAKGSIASADPMAKSPENTTINIWQVSQAELAKSASPLLGTLRATATANSDGSFETRFAFEDSDSVVVSVIPVASENKLEITSGLDGDAQKPQMAIGSMFGEAAMNPFFSTDLPISKAPVVGALGRWIPLPTRPASKINFNSFYVTSSDDAFYMQDRLQHHIRIYKPASNEWTLLDKCTYLMLISGGPSVIATPKNLICGTWNESAVPANEIYRLVAAKNPWLKLPATNWSNLGSGVYRLPLAFGEKLIVWGGAQSTLSPVKPFSTGAVYDLATNAWNAMSTVSAPSPRTNQVQAIVDGELIIWGGVSTSKTDLNDGGIYNFESNTWRPLPITATTPQARGNAESASGGGYLLIFGGRLQSPMSLQLHDGALFNSASNTWHSLPLPPGYHPISERELRVMYPHAIAWDGDRFAFIWSHDECETIQTAWLSPTELEPLKWDPGINIRGFAKDPKNSGDYCEIKAAVTTNDLIIVTATRSQVLDPQGFQGALIK